MCVRERERECVCVYACVGERERVCACVCTCNLVANGVTRGTSSFTFSLYTRMGVESIGVCACVHACVYVCSVCVMGGGRAEGRIIVFKRARARSHALSLSLTLSLSLSLSHTHTHTHARIHAPRGAVLGMLTHRHTKTRT